MTTKRGHTGPAQGTPEIENEQVTVIRFRIPPHHKIPLHEVTPRVVVWLTGGRLRLTFPDGSSEELLPRAGDTQWLPTQSHAGENLGDTPIEFVAVIPKTSPGGPQ